jgi:hypothetical protein
MDKSFKASELEEQGDIMRPLAQAYWVAVYILLK